MKRIRLIAIGSVLLIGIYFVFRASATSCAGPACDLYIPASLLIPLLIFATVATSAALATARSARNSGWFAALLALTLVATAGPMLALLVLRDNPDAFVAIATSIELVVAVSVLAYSFLGERAG